MFAYDTAIISQNRLTVLFFILGLLSLPAMAQRPEPPPEKPASDVATQMTSKDVLLRELEGDYQLLLKQSPHQEKIRESELLLRELDDRSQWTNYSKATAILKQYRDLAAIPLLLRYCILHAGKSSAHIIIPEYRRTIIEISGHTMPELYEAGPNRVESTLQAVNKVVENWWREFKDTLFVSVAKMDPAQLKVMADQLLDRVRKEVDLSGSGGKVGSAYHTLHVMYYRMNARRDESFKFDRNDRLVPVILAKIGYPKNKSDVSMEGIKSESFPFEIAWILGEFSGDATVGLLQNIVADQSQNAVVRLASTLALMRMGRDVEVEHVSTLLKAETDRQRKMICLLMLRWFDGDGMDPLLLWMQDEDIEIASAAACALRDIKPTQAIERFKRLMDRALPDSPILLLGELADYEQQAARDLMESLLRQSLEGQKHTEHLGRIVDACAESWGIDRNRYQKGAESDINVQARRLLTLVAELRKQQLLQKRKLEGMIESLNAQIEIATQIETLRRSEYKRLLSLQGDGIVEAAESQKAAQRLQESTDEVKDLNHQLLQYQSLVETFDDRKPKLDSKRSSSLFGE